MDTKIEIPTFDWFERYKLSNHAAWSSFIGTHTTVQKIWGEEGFKKFDNEYRKAAFHPVGQKLVEKLNLEPDIEGVLKIAGAYTQEVWGYGDSRFVEIFKNGPNKGTLRISVCRGYEKWHKNTGVDCGYACDSEYRAVTSALSPDVKVALVKAYPWGDDHCEFVFEIFSNE